MITRPLVSFKQQRGATNSNFMPCDFRMDHDGVIPETKPTPNASEHLDGDTALPDEVDKYGELISTTSTHQPHHQTSDYPLVKIHADVAHLSCGCSKHRLAARARCACEGETVEAGASCGRPVETQSVPQLSSPSLCLHCQVDARPRSRYRKAAVVDLRLS